MSFNHLVAGIFPDVVAAEAAHSQLVRENISTDRITLLNPSDKAVVAPDSDFTDSLDDKTSVLAGAAAGGGLGLSGGLVAGALVMVAAPVITTLLATGMGALAGAAAGKAFSKSMDGEAFGEIVRESLANGHCAVVVSAENEADALQAQAIFAETEAMKSVDHGGGVREPAAG